MSCSIKLFNELLTVIILTRDEERHIARAIESVAAIAREIIVVDSGSTDRTIEIAEAKGAHILCNPWTNHASQFNWALDQLSPDSGWVLRLDADEIVSPELANEIASRLDGLGAEITGVSVGRRMNFLGRPVRRGGVFPVRLIRIFRHGCGKSEHRWMDEHIVVSGQVTEFSGEIIDDNLNSLSWWTAKHNDYSSREAIELLNLEYGFMIDDGSSLLHCSREAGWKRLLKEKLYARLPLGLRAFCYFLYRYLFRLGFLDSREGAAFHILQGFWYRYLVDIKLYEVKCRMEEGDIGIVEAISEVLDLDVRTQLSSRANS